MILPTISTPHQESCVAGTGPVTTNKSAVLGISSLCNDLVPQFSREVY